MKLRLFGLVLLAVPLMAAPPQVINGTIQSVASLSQAEAISGPSWIGYSLITSRPLSVNCCDGWSGNCNRCKLEGDRGFSVTRGDRDDLRPAGSDRVVLFARVVDRQVNRMRLFSPDCTIDASGQTVVWVDNVAQTESVAFLSRVVDRSIQRARTQALMALSLQQGGTDTLIDIARHNSSHDIRSKALFWLAQEAGEKVASTLRDAVDNDPEEDVRAKAVFAISQLPGDQSIPMLIDLVKSHRSTAVRKKAIFWLGQKNDPRALAAIEDILRR